MLLPKWKHPITGDVAGILRVLEIFPAAADFNQCWKIDVFAAELRKISRFKK